MDDTHQQSNFSIFLKKTTLKACMAANFNYNKACGIFIWYFYMSPETKVASNLIQYQSMPEQFQ